MCRLVAYVGEPLSPAELVFGGDHSLARQSWAPRELLSGSVNADGYGVVWYAEGQPARIADPRPIWHDSDLESTLRSVRSDVVLGALRNGTPGLMVDRSSLLPLVSGRYSFALNGFVPDFRRSHMRALRSHLSDELYAELIGSSDSETLFLLALGALQAGATLTESLVETARLVAARVGSEEAQLNMVLSDGAGVAMVRTGTEPETNSLYLNARPSFAPGGVVLASEPTHPNAEGWTVVQPHSSVLIETSGLIRFDEVRLG
ncbi:MAG: class II glutamine amidotransferase [Gemmatimonadota bacterium]